MKTIPVGALKTNFSKVLDDVRQGHSVTIAFGRKHQPVAMIVPYRAGKASGIRLGALADCSCEINDDFSITDEQLVSL